MRFKYSETQDAAIKWARMVTGNVEELRDRRITNRWSILSLILTSCVVAIILALKL